MGGLGKGLTAACASDLLPWCLISPAVDAAAARAGAEGSHARRHFVQFALACLRDKTSTQANFARANSKSGPFPEMLIVYKPHRNARLRVTPTSLPVMSATPSLWSSDDPELWHAQLDSYWTAIEALDKPKLLDLER